MNRRIAAIAASVALVISFVIPSAISVAAGKSGASHFINTSNCSAIAPTVKYPAAPKDPFAKQDKTLAGTTITYYGGSVGTDHDGDVPLCVAFEKSTGIKVNIVTQSSSSITTLSTLEGDFQSHSSTPSVTRMDVVWPGTIGKYLLPLGKSVSADTKLEIKSILQNDTVGGKLRALPYQGDFGMLYYRKDLLQKYHLKVPTTWSQLTSEAKTIQTGERKAGNGAFWGWVFQGDAYEGLTCDSLEWLASSGGGTFITHSGKVTVDNPKAASMLKLAQSWPGNISPPDVTTYQEGQTANAYAARDAAFARNWPYMYSPSIIGNLQSKTGVAPLPHGPGKGEKSSATVGGWQVGVNGFTKGKVRAAALAWARYYASYKVQVWRATYAGIVPTMNSVGKVKSVKKAQPFLASVGPKEQRVTRPTILGGNYDKGSTDIWDAVNNILGGADVNSQLSTLQSQLKALHP